MKFYTLDKEKQKEVIIKYLKDNIIITNVKGVFTMNTNLILMVDSYKSSHFLQLPPNTEYQSSYIESRGGKWDHTVVFGLQMFLMEYLTKPITQDMIDEAEAFWSLHGEPFNKEGWEYILEVHRGYLPLEIKAVPEGTVLPNRNVMVQVVNTDPKCFWLTSYVETALLRAIWYASTVATNSYACKEIIWEYLQKTSDNPTEQIGFKLHDFGARGVSSAESAGIGGAAHLINFFGTDTVEGVMYARKYYDEEMAGFSIPAMEHSTVTAWGGPEQEIDAFRNMMKHFAKPGALVAFVSDSYDIYNAVDNLWGDKLKEEVIKSGATIVVRPDSGNPEKVPTAVILGLIAKYGHTTNSKGYAVLPDHIRVIQGDGITVDTIEKILINMEHNGLSADNIAFGQGGGLLQQVNRDTLEFAMKCSAIRVDGIWRDVWKDPVTDSGKASKRGRLALKYECGLGSCGYKTVPAKYCKEEDNLLIPVYRNGIILDTTTFTEIRKRANKAFV